MSSCNESCSDIEDEPRRCLKPCVPMYGPANLRGLKKGDIKLWCTCGLSTTQPWCDDEAHKGTPFKPLRWTVPNDQSLYSICNCKYTTNPPYCDAEHIHLPLKYITAQKECTQNHSAVKKLCSYCGFRPTPEALSSSSQITSTVFVP
ncbi:hypothetical protein DFS34DRAFT_604004 [Phlyctochytrium arcticum]|nr:hypothetical protein DFS34DRAFT_604004 [Phlyctochytrium arcticum]